jgi:hypothetical protein
MQQNTNFYNLSIYYLFYCDDEKRPLNMGTDESYPLLEYENVFKLKAKLDKKGINYDLLIQRFDKINDQVLSNDYLVANNYLNALN